MASGPLSYRVLISSNGPQAHVFPDSSRKVSFDETISYSYYRQLTRKQPRCIRKFVKINEKSV